MHGGIRKYHGNCGESEGLLVSVCPIYTVVQLRSLQPKKKVGMARESAVPLAISDAIIAANL